VNKASTIVLRRSIVWTVKPKKPRNPVARELRDPRFRKQIVKSKKVYDRKKLSLDSILETWYNSD
jgi:hypothetical protein